MPATTPIHQAAFDAIDNLHFNKVVLSFVCNDPIAEWYPRILIRINKILQEASLTGKQAEIAKHYLLGALEIYLSVEDKLFLDMVEYPEDFRTGDIPEDGGAYKKSTKTVRDFSVSMLYIAAGYNGVDTRFLDRAIEELMNDEELALSTSPRLIKYRLAEYCYALEYMDAPLGFYRELISLGVISCGKYSRNSDQYAKKSAPGSSLLFIRAGLLFEFKMLQRTVAVMVSLKNNGAITFPKPNPQMPRTERQNIADYYKRLVDDWFFGEKGGSFVTFQCEGDISGFDVAAFLRNMSKFYFHKRMFGGTQGSWLGTLGAFEIEGNYNEEPEMAIYYDGDNSNTISEKIRVQFQCFGFNVSARSLYLRHRAVKKDSYSKIRYYIFLLLNQPVLIPWHLDSNNYYYMALGFDGSEINRAELP